MAETLHSRHVTHKPSFTPPPLSCDAHCHIFGPAAVFPYAPDRRYTPEDAPKEDLAALHQDLGIDRAVIVQASCHGSDNRAMLDAIAWRPDRYRGVAIVDGSESDKDLEAFDKGGVRGVRFNFVKHLGGVPDLALLERTLDRIAPLGWHVVLHFDAPGILEFNDLVRSFKIPFIIDHMGRVPAKDGLDQAPFKALLELQKLDNCWVKVCGADRVSTAGPPFHDSTPFARALVEGRPDRVLWGTDFPHPNAKHVPDNAGLVELLPMIAPDPALRQKLLVDNPAQLYGF
jgi:2-pyrone-4,6-dicarboxylate lactonase